MKKNLQKGFTLVELMIVVAIIGILAAIAIPKFADMLEKSREGATKGNLSSINSGIALYVSDNQGQVPLTLDLATGTINAVSYPAFITQYMDSLPGVKCTAKKGIPAGAKSPLGAKIVYASTTAPVGGQTCISGIGWLYNPNTAAGADFWVNSIAGDMKSSPTVTYEYTLYGYE